ncbi:DUF4238 domain-containing protein [Janthinobacterium lividum]
MQQTKRHHYVPKAYLKGFSDQRGRVLVYRKDGPATPLHLAPDATQFRRYYYSQPTPDGGQDNNKLEQFFSEVESDWPATIAKLYGRENANDRIENIMQFMSLQRVRVPAARDVAEAVLAQTVKDTLAMMLAEGKLPKLPPGLEDLPNRVQVSIDPHRSIHAMVAMLQGMEKLCTMVGFAVIHNATTRPFLTSDNPVLWFDPSLPFDKQRPYTINPDGGAILLFFPLSPTLVLVGSTEYNETYKRHGLLHSDAPDESWVDLVNEQVCRFAYEAVIAQSAGQEELIAKYVDVSPIHESVVLPVTTGAATLHSLAFGPRVAKPKWRGE